MFNATLDDSNSLAPEASSNSLSFSNAIAGGIISTQELLSPCFREPLALTSPLEIGDFNSPLDVTTTSGDVSSSSSLFLFAQQESFTTSTGGNQATVAQGNTQSSNDSLIGLNTADTLVGSPSQNLKVDNNITLNSFARGTLTDTDPLTYDNLRYRNDYLLTGLAGGEQVQVNMNANFDSLLVLLNADTGQPLGFNNDSNGTLNSQLTFTAEVGVNYLVRATSFTGAATGNYNLRTNVGTPIPATFIGANTTISGSLVKTDFLNPTRSQSLSDNYLLRGVVPGRAVQVNMNAEFDTYLQVVNADTGEVLTSNDDASGSLNSQLGFIAEAGVNYLLRATSYGENLTGDYSLTTQQVLLPEKYNLNDGYGLVDAAAAVAGAVGEIPFANVADLGGNNWGLDMINAPEVWAQGYTGQGIVVAVVDSGVDYNHPDLAANIWVNAGEIPGNGIDDDGNGYVDDVRGWNFVGNNNNPMDLNDHGTHVAGTIAGVNNNFGVTGVAYDARIMPVRALGTQVLDTENDASSSNIAIAAGIRYAVDNGANVINLSLGSIIQSSEIKEAIEYATALGSVVVMASGNRGSTEPGAPAFLASNTGVAVGAIDANRTIADFSNQAGLPVLNYVVAPGVQVYSTTRNNTYSYFDGTSMATPHVAGVAALMLSANPGLTPAEVASLLSQTASQTDITV